MAIIGFQGPTTGTVDLIPNLVYFNTNDTVATVTTAGYLTSWVQENDIALFNYYFALVNTTNGAVLLQISITGPAGNQVYSFIPPVNAGGAIFAGNVQAGLNGTAGAFISYPAAMNTGHLTLAAAANAGNTVNTITNASMAGTRTFTIPDPGVAAAQFILNNNAGTQTIATGNLAVSHGSLISGSAAGGQIGTLQLFSTGAALGNLTITASNNAGNTQTLLTNASFGQATIITIPDPGNANAALLIGATAAPFTANHSLVASGTTGVVADAGYQMKTVAGAVIAGGAAAQTINDAFCTAASNVVGNFNTQTNPASVLTITPGVGSFVVTASADPGASTFNYIITKV